MLKKALDERVYSQIQNYYDLARKFLVEKTLDAFGQEIKSLPFIFAKPNSKLPSFLLSLISCCSHYNDQWKSKETLNL